VLGAVRDLDVNIEQARTYLETLPRRARPDLEQLIADWKTNERPTGQTAALTSTPGAMLSSLSASWSSARRRAPMSPIRQ